MEFGDYQCPACAMAEPIFHEADAQRPGLVRWVFKHFPLPYHRRAFREAVAAECAHAQGLFWPMHDLLYAHQDAVTDDDLAAYAAQSGLDMPAWSACMESDAPTQRVLADMRQAEQSEVDATPTFWINGKRFVGAQPLDDLLKAIDEAHAQAISTGLPAVGYYETLEQKGCE